MQRRLHLVIPGDLRTVTGGYIYDRRIVAGLRDLDWQVDVHSLADSFPFPAAADLEAADRELAHIAADELVLIDGLALGAMPEVVARHAQRLCLLALVHHPLAAEAGLSATQQQLLQKQERSALACVRHVIVTSPATGAALADYDVGPKRIAVIEPGTDRAPLALGRRRRDPAPLQMLCVATLIPRKGHALLLAALAALRSERWHLTCVGSVERSPATVAALRELLAQPALAGRVTLAGELSGDELALRYESADLFVLPTLYEGFGMAVAEAIAHGLPVISTRTGAIPQIVPADAGLLLPPGDLPALQTALARVLREPQLLRQLGRGAESARAALKDWTAVARKMSTLLQGLQA
ncbi:MAG: glycosyltransferase family 4 protein [Pseudomonadota bacterium]